MEQITKPFTILSGPGTATMSISNTAALKIQLIDDTSLYAQFIAGVPQEPVVCKIEYIPVEGDDEWKPAFYYEDDQNSEPYYLDDFIRDDYGAL